jgi:hypothetical protein
MTWPGLTQDVEHIDFLCSTCQVCQMAKKEPTRKKYGLLPPKIAESDNVPLVHGLCRSGGSIYNKDTSQNTLFVSLIALTMIDPEIKHRLV